MDDRAFIRKWWDEAWSEGLWAAAWCKSIEGLTAEQAAWRPPSAPGVAEPRHSIWQNVLHMVFWRESWLRRVATGVKPSAEELARGNWPETTSGERGWAEARARLAETQKRIAGTLADPGLSEEHAATLAYFLPHDCYHFGQINMMRGMLGMKAIE
jgi:uncharacterized damage-inducible protein DinB